MLVLLACVMVSGGSQRICCLRQDGTLASASSGPGAAAKTDPPDATDAQSASDGKGAGVGKTEANDKKEGTCFEQVGA